MPEPRIATVRPVAEHEAAGRVAEIYRDIKATKKIDFVPSFWRVLATNPDHLELVWTRLKALIAGTGRQLDIEIYSQGDPSMFADLADLGAELKLDAPALETHRALVDSDILVMSKGAFSYTAGVLHDGITLYDPQKYRPLKGWIARAPDGTFDEALVARRILNPEPR